LKELPILNENLEDLNCVNNQLYILPLIHTKLRNIVFSKNPIYNVLFANNNNSHHHQYFYAMNANGELDQMANYVNYINENVNQTFLLREKIQTLYHFRSLFYTLKYKDRFRDFLWDKIRRPKIEAKYHPSNLQKLIDELNEEDDLTELLESW
jgi:hypothetical protein